MQYLILIPVLLFLFYVLYLSGLFIFTSKRAAMYVGADRGNAARFAACTGFTKKVLRFAENRTYQLDFSCQLSKGSLTVIISDSDKKELAVFTESSNTKTLSVEKGKRYYLTVRMDRATGYYQLNLL